MSTTMYFLKPLEGDDKALIEIPEGKVTIGRGPFLSCTDKRVSRIHAELELTAGDHLSITPKHVNPTFYRKNGESGDFQQLGVGKPCLLKAGDHISLLHNSLLFEIVTEFKSERISDSSVMEMDYQPGEIDAPKPLSSENAKESNKNVQIDQASENVEIETKTRTLPHWMIEASKSEPLNKNDDKSTRKKVVKKTPPKKSSNTAQDLSEDDDRETPDQLDVPGPTGANRKVVADSSEINNGVSSSTVKLKNVKDEDETVKNRLPCEYGGKCYRKNPAHKEKYCHPGDEDYEMSLQNNNDDDDDSRPECEYGTACYRKNPKHRKEFKHSAKPKRKAALKAKRQKLDEQDSDDDQYDESFIDDDSDEYNPNKDDADYSSDDEDTEVLNAEAKSFMNNKKMFSSS